jgi:hypothetical protein
MNLRELLISYSPNTRELAYKTHCRRERANNFLNNVRVFQIHNTHLKVKYSFNIYYVLPVGMTEPEYSSNLF